jgi:hypothetical protein
VIDLAWCFWHDGHLRWPASALGPEEGVSNNNTPPTARCEHPSPRTGGDLARHSSDYRSRPQAAKGVGAILALPTSRAERNAGRDPGSCLRPPPRQSRDHQGVRCQVRLADRRIGRALARTGVTGQPRRRGDRGDCRVEGAEPASKHGRHRRQSERSRNERRSQTRASPRKEQPVLARWSAPGFEDT